MTNGSVDQIYRDQVILDHCRNPRNQRIVKFPDFTGDAVNPFVEMKFIFRFDWG